MSDPTKTLRIKTLLELQIKPEYTKMGDTLVRVGSPLDKMLNRKWVEVEGLGAELQKKARWRIEENVSTEMEGETSVTRFRPRQYVRLDWFLALLVASPKKET